MALTRNESAVHEKIGVFENINLRQACVDRARREYRSAHFPVRWAHGFAVTQDRWRRGAPQPAVLRQGRATPFTRCTCARSSNLDAYQRIVEDFSLEDQSQEFVEARVEHASLPRTARSVADELRDEWSRLTDTHQFLGLLRKLKLGRRPALHSVGEDFAWKLADGAVDDMMHASGQGRPADHVLRRQSRHRPDPFRAARQRPADGSVAQHHGPDLPPASAPGSSRRDLGRPQADAPTAMSPRWRP